jgi:hypothetical protein
MRDDTFRRRRPQWAVEYQECCSQVNLGIAELSGEWEPDDVERAAELSRESDPPESKPRNPKRSHKNLILIDTIGRVMLFFA